MCSQYEKPFCQKSAWYMTSIYTNFTELNNVNGYPEVFLFCYKYKEVKKCTPTVIILAPSPEFNCWPLWMAPVTSIFWTAFMHGRCVYDACLAGYWHCHGFRHLAAWLSTRFPMQGFPANSFLCTKACVCLLVKCPLFLTDLNWNWDVLINFRRTPSMNFRGNLFSCSWVVICVQMDGSILIGTPRLMNSSKKTVT